MGSRVEDAERGRSDVCILEYFASSCRSVMTQPQSDQKLISVNKVSGLVRSVQGSKLKV